MAYTDPFLFLNSCLNKAIFQIDILSLVFFVEYGDTTNLCNNVHAEMIEWLKCRVFIRLVLSALGEIFNGIGVVGLPNLRPQIV